MPGGIGLHAWREKRAKPMRAQYTFLEEAGLREEKSFIKINTLDSVSPTEHQSTNSSLKSGLLGHSEWQYVHSP